MCGGRQETAEFADLDSMGLMFSVKSSTNKSIAEN
jgi:hypothetical protein